MTRTLSDVATEIRQLAPFSEQGERVLRDLADRLSGTGRAGLVGVDLATTYAPDVMLPDGPPFWRRLANGLELARDVLIFVPVMYTWWKIAQALDAYDHYRGSAPFLLAWQEGFGGRTDPLSSSASVVAAVVLTVVVLTVVAQLVRGRYDAQVQYRRQRLAVLLGEAGMLLTRTLVTEESGVSRTDLATISTTIATSSQALQEALAQSGKDIAAAVNAGPGSDLHRMFTEWIAAAGELRAMGTRLQNTQETVEQMRDTQSALSGLAKSIAEETSKLITALETERELSRQEAHSHHQLAGEVGASTKLLGDSLKALNDRAEQFSELILRLDYIVRNMDTSGALQ